MTTEPKPMIAIQIESDIKTFADWVLNYKESIPVNIAFDDETIEGFFVESYFQHLPGGHSGLYFFRLFTEIIGLRPTDLMIRTDDKWVMEIEELSQGKVPIGSVRVERVNSNSINVFFWSVVLGSYLKPVYERIFNAICEDFFINRPPEMMINEYLQPGEAEIIPPDDDLDSEPSPVIETDPDTLISNVELMKKFHPDYNPLTAKAVYKAIPSGWKEYQRVGGRWGPGFISKFCNFHENTVGRYLGAFRSAGLKEVNSGSEIIPIPHSPRPRSNR